MEKRYINKTIVIIISLFQLEAEIDEKARAERARQVLQREKTLAHQRNFMMAKLGRGPDGRKKTEKRKGEADRKKREDKKREGDRKEEEDRKAEEDDRRDQSGDEDGDDAPDNA